jgi:hypothetical protein
MRLDKVISWKLLRDKKDIVWGARSGRSFPKSFWNASKEIEFVGSGGWCHDNTRINLLSLRTSSGRKVVHFVDAVYSDTVQQMVAQIYLELLNCMEISYPLSITTNHSFISSTT